MKAAPEEHLQLFSKFVAGILGDFGSYLESGEINGFITLRYDKRGTHSSKGNYMETGFWDLVDDAESAASLYGNRQLTFSENIKCPLIPKWNPWAFYDS